MLRKIPRKLGLAALVAVGLTDLQLYVLRFHPPTEMLGRYLRQHIIPDEPTGASDIPDLRSRMEAPLQKV